MWPQCAWPRPDLILQHLTLHTDLNFLLRIAVALALSGVLGWEREKTGKAAGIRTHMLVGIGSAMFVMLGEMFVQRFRNYDINMRFDPLRIVEAVVTGISFLGAGTIFVSRSKERVQGLTTAASIWVTSAVGMAAGLERYVMAFGSTVIVFLVLHATTFMDVAAAKTKDKDDLGAGPP